MNIRNLKARALCVAAGFAAFAICMSAVPGLMAQAGDKDKIFTVQKEAVSVSGETNIYAGASAESGAVAVCDEGTILYILSQKGGWYYVEQGNVYGYIKEKDVSDVRGTVNALSEESETKAETVEKTKNALGKTTKKTSGEKKRKSLLKHASSLATDDGTYVMAEEGKNGWKYFLAAVKNGKVTKTDITKNGQISSEADTENIQSVLVSPKYESGMAFVKSLYKSCNIDFPENFSDLEENYEETTKDPDAGDVAVLNGKVIGLYGANGMVYAVNEGLLVKTDKTNKMEFYDVFSGEKEETVSAETAVLYTWTGSKLTKSKGVNYGPSGKETYYNLDMSGVVSIMRGMGFSESEYPYEVRSDGVKTLGGYVMVAANLSVHPRGSLVETSLGTGIVCDTGGFAYNGSGTAIDIAVSW